MITIGTDEALQMIAAGWQVRYLETLDCIEWRSPKGMTTDSWKSESLDSPPWSAVQAARRAGHITNRERTAGR